VPVGSGAPLPSDANCASSKARFALNAFGHDSLYYLLSYIITSGASPPRGRSLCVGGRGMWGGRSCRQVTPARRATASCTCRW